MNTTTMETSPPPKVIRIGVLALQGAFVEHVQALQRLKLSHLEVVLVREPHQLHSSSSPLDGLIIPGGESTSMVLIAERTNMIEPLRGFVRDPKKAVWGTCAGLILLSNHVEGQKEGGQAVLGGLEVSCSRNYFGRQVKSFVTNLNVDCFGKDSAPHEAVFIRAPAVLRILDEAKVERLADIPDANDEKKRVIVAVRQGTRLLGTAFHPELTEDDRWHALFVKMVQQNLASCSPL